MSSFIRALRRPGNLKHKKLCEEWGENREPVLEGITFFVKYVGSCLVEEAKGEQATADAIKTIIAMTKNGNRKLDRVSFTVNEKGVKVSRQESSQALELEVPICRISYCSADAYYDHVFAFIAINTNETLECHAFLCPKKKIAHAVTLTIAQAFNLAFESWQSNKEDPRCRRHSEESECSAADGLESNASERPDEHVTDLPSPRTALENAIVATQQALLIDIGDGEDEEGCTSPQRLAQWNFEDDFNCELNFEQFIQMRFYPHRSETETVAIADFHHHVVSNQRLVDDGHYLRPGTTASATCDLFATTT